MTKKATIQTKSGQPRITVVINTINEEKNIAACIRSARLLSKDILVVDMKSSDGTVKIAKKLGVTVIPVKNYGYVEPARAVGLDKAQGEWIFVLDADERITPALAAELKKIAASPTHDIYSIPRKNIILGKWIRHTAWWPDNQIRFFKKGMLRWGKTIHAWPIMKGTRYDLPPREAHALVHYNFRSVAALAERMPRYARFEPAERSKGIKSVLDLAHTLDADFRWRFIEKEGYKDGAHGYILSEFMRFYRLLIFMNHWERLGYPNLPGSKKLAEGLKHTADIQASMNSVPEPDDMIVRMYKRLRRWVRNHRK